MKIAITGGGGFIGRALQAELQAHGYEPLSLDLSTGFDVRERFDFGQDIGGVIHLAGVLGTHELFDDMELAIDTNIRGTINVLDAVVRHGKRIPYVGITMPPVFPSIYTATKIAAAAFERVYRHEYGIPMVKVRAFNAFGPGQAHGPGHPQKIIPTFACESWARRPIPIWGDGTQTVDLISTTELARVLRNALQVAAYLTGAASSTDITIDGGTGVSFSVLQVASTVNRITGSNAGVVHLPMRRGEVPTTIKAEGEGWDLLDRKPELDMRELRDAVESYRDHQMVDWVTEWAK